MRSGTALACGAAAAAGAAYLLYRMASKSAAPALPVTLPDKQGNTVVVRLATPDDLEAVKTRIADHTGTGSGTGGDDFLIQEFRKNVVDPNYTVLFAETAAGVGLGMTIIAWSGRSMMGGAGQSYWQSLRVAQDSRGRGIAALLLVTRPAHEHGCPRRRGREPPARKRSRCTHRRHAIWRRRQSRRGACLGRRRHRHATATRRSRR